MIENFAARCIMDNTPENALEYCARAFLTESSLLINAV